MRTVPRATRRGKPVRMPYFTIKLRHLSRIQQVFLYMLVPFMTKYRDKYKYNTFSLQQEGRSESAILTHQRLRYNTHLTLYLSGI